MSGKKIIVYCFWENGEIMYAWCIRRHMAVAGVDELVLDELGDAETGAEGAVEGLQREGEHRGVPLGAAGRPGPKVEPR